MAPRNRHSSTRPPSSRPSNASPASSPATDKLPPYKKPSHPLDVEATRALRDLQGRYLRDVKKHNTEATAAITKSAEDVNDELRKHGEYLARRRKKWDAGKDLEDKEAEEPQMEELTAKVEAATARLEESMRAIIDSSRATERLDETLDWLRTNAPRQLEEKYRTRSQLAASQWQTQTQAQSQQRRTQGEDDDEDVDEGPTPGPTPLESARVVLTGASELFTTRMQNGKDEYTSNSLNARYALNNDYIGFKNIVHDAKYGDNGPVLGHSDTWFTITGSPAPGITDSTQRGEFEDGDDLAIDRENISTRCPLTYQQFKDPYSSTLCPHTFEKNAILDMIRQSRGQGLGGKRAAQCPIPGCAKMLTADDLRSDPVLVRKIKRILQAEAAEAEDDSDDEDQDPRPSQVVGDDGDDAFPSSRRSVVPKQERVESSMIEE